MEIFSWGNNIFGQLGFKTSENEDEEEHLLPRGIKIGGLNSSIDAIACGWNHTLFLMDDGSVYSCGLNSDGQLGYERDPNIHLPEQIKSLEALNILYISCGEDFSVVVNNKGEVFSFGSNEQGELGDGTNGTSHAIPRQIKGISPGILIASVSCGRKHAVALSTGGHVFTWGGNSHGQLGVGSTEAQIPYASHVKALSGYPVSQVAAGGCHTFALTFTGLVFGWGSNSSGQLGLGNTESQWAPVKVQWFDEMRIRAKFIDCGEDHTVVLSSDGILLTFGCGISGQLGHNEFCDEAKPRAVEKLSGKKITQVACGRKHTLCFSFDGGEMFAFGLNVKGQLGLNSYQKQNIPMKVSAPWSSVSYDLPSNLWNAAQRYENIYFKRQSSCLVNEIRPENVGKPFLFKIFSGGLQSFVSTFKSKPPGIPINRLLTSSESLFYLTHEICEEMVAKGREQDKKALLLISTVFSNPSCLNASFLDREAYNRRTLESHSVRLMAVHQSCSLLFKNNVFKSTIIQSVKQNLLSLLNNVQDDLECLRVFIIIPEVLNKCESDDTWHMVHSFSRTILNLGKFSKSVLISWWSQFPATFFERLLQCFQRVLVNAFSNPSNVCPNLVKAIEACLEVMKKLFEVNEAMGEILVHSAFYVAGIFSKINIAEDFQQWITNPEGFSFCKYSFIFETKNKAEILELDAELQMKIMMNNIHMRNLAGVVHGNLDVPFNPFLVLDIRRDFIVQDTLNCILAQDLSDLKKPLRVRFQNEDGEDAGGVRKEFFLLLMKEILDPRYGMFDFYNDSGTLWFKPGSFEGPSMFLVIGVICGLAIYNSVIIDLAFPITLYRKLLNKKTTLNDFMEINPNVAKSLQKMLDYTGDDFEEVFGLSFQITELIFDELKTRDLKENGSNIAVTQANKYEYVELYVNYKVNTSVEEEFRAFYDGFHRVCSGSIIRCLHPQELMELIVGSNEYNFSDLEKIAEYKGEYHRNHPVINLFWETFYSFNLDKKKMFLAFLTGTNKVSIRGIKHMKFIIQPMLTDESSSHLPVAHTCFNILDLPQYSSLETMNQKISLAIENSEGFGLV